jgi:hypothetical protein
MNERYRATDRDDARKVTKPAEGGDREREAVALDKF